MEWKSLLVLNNRPLTYVESKQEQQYVLIPDIILWGQDAYTIDGSDSEDEVTKLYKHMKNKREHAWRRWKTKYLHSLLEHHRVNRRQNACPEVGEIVLVVGNEWRRGKVVELVRGKDNVVRGVKILTKGHTIERPLPLVCSPEIKKSKSIEDKLEKSKTKETDERIKIRQCFEDEEDTILLLG